MYQGDQPGKQACKLTIVLRCQRKCLVSAEEISQGIAILGLRETACITEATTDVRGQDSAVSAGRLRCKFHTVFVR